MDAPTISMSLDGQRRRAYSRLMNGTIGSILVIAAGIIVGLWLATALHII